ncbi:MAG: NADH-quinone oxidoreductase subunit J [Planctomycetales bacterium]|nr:NADH-quinone oxidoreductase subunit J [Planctomycetales bacterium]
MNHVMWLAQLIGDLGDVPVEPEAIEPEFRFWWVLAAILLLLFWLIRRNQQSRRQQSILLAVAGVAALYGLSTPAQPAIDKWLANGWAGGGHLLSSCLLWGLLLTAAALIMMLPRGSSKRQLQGFVVWIVGLGFLAASMPALSETADLIVFWVLAAVTLVSAVAAVSMRSAVYCAIWFAMSLLGTAGLFFFQGSQFLGVATIVVYAGAIVVTFLFVVMLAQPEGQATYDRLSWGGAAKPLAAIATALLVAALVNAVHGDTELRQAVASAAERLKDNEGERLLADNQIVGVSERSGTLRVTVRRELDVDAARGLEQALSDALDQRVTVHLLDPARDVLQSSHMARLGGEMFSRQLLSVELAGALLLAALVGAISMAVQGKQNDPVARGAGVEDVR